MTQVLRSVLFRRERIKLVAILAILALVTSSIVSLITSQQALAAFDTTENVTDISPTGVGVKAGATPAMLKIDLQDTVNNNLESIVVNAGSTAEADIDRVSLYLDDGGLGCGGNGNGSWDFGTDTLLGYTGATGGGTAALSGGTATFDKDNADGGAGTGDLDAGGTVGPCAMGTAETYFVVYEVATSGATDTNTLTAQIGQDQITDSGAQTGPAAAAPATAASITLDTSAPQVTNFYTVDDDGDGDVDAFDITFSEPIADATVVASEFEFDANTTNNGDETAGTGTSTSVDYPSADTDGGDEYYRITLTNDVNEMPGTDEHYLHIIGTSLTDQAGNAIATGDDVGIPNDEASPIVESIETTDSDDDGKVDAMEVLFSEPMDDVSFEGYVDNSTNFTPTTLAVATVTGEEIEVTTGARTCQNDASASDEYVCIVFDEIGGACDSTGQAGCDTDLTYDVTFDASSTIADANGNDAVLNSGDVVEADGAPPVLVDQLYYSNGNNGTTDTIELTFSENVTWNYSDLGQFAIVNQGVTGLDDDGTPESATGSGTDQLTLTTSGSTNDTGSDGGTEPTIAYTASGTPANNVVDANSQGLSDFGATALSDDAEPYLYQVDYEDFAGDDGTVDRVVMYWTEEVNVTMADADWAFTTPGDIALAGDFDNTECDSGTDIITCTDADAGSFSSFSQYSGKQTSAGTEPVWVYTNNSDNVVEAHGTNPANGRTITLTDNADPIVIYAQLDNSLEWSIFGPFNSIILGFSEAMWVSTDGGGDSDLSANSGSASNANVGDMTSARTVSGIGSWDGSSNMTTINASDNYVHLAADEKTLYFSLNVQDNSYFNAGTTGPVVGSDTFTPDNNGTALNDTAGNPVNNLNTPTFTGDAWDVTPPTVTDTYSCDLEPNGRIGTLQINFSEAMYDDYFGTGTGFWLDGDDDGTDNDQGSSFSTSTLGCDGNAAVNVADDEYITIDFGIGVQGTDAAYLNHVTAGARDTYGNRLALGDALGTEHDMARPVISSYSNSTSAAYNRVYISYSEPMTYTAGASSSSLGDITTAGTIAGIGTYYTVGDVTVTTTGNTLSASGNAYIEIFLAAEDDAYINAGATTMPSGDITPIASPNLVDAAGLQVNTAYAGSPGPPVAWDLTPPTILSATLADAADGDGRADQATIVFSEDMRDSSIVNADGALDGQAGAYTTGTANDDTTVFDVTSDDAIAIDTSATAAEWTHAGTRLITDLAGNLLNAATDGEVVAGDVVEADGMAPVIVSVSPADAATSVLPADSIVVTFSEPMDGDFAYGTEFTLDTNPGSWVTTPNGDSSAYTLTHANFDYSTSYTVTIDDTAVDADAGSPTQLVTTGPQDEEWTFTTRQRPSSGGGSAPAPKTYSVTVLGPNGGESYNAGDTVNLTWETGGTGSVNYVNLWYSADAGANYTEIASSVQNTGSYAWTAPTAGTYDGSILVEATDLAATLTSDASDQVFTVVGTMDETQDETEPTPEGETTAPDSDEMGVSPITGEPEVISVVNPGDYIRSVYFNTVYYVDSNMVRHPFMDAQTYYTWQDTFNTVKVVTDATLPTFELGAMMVPKPGVVLIKIQSVNNVYAVESDPLDMFAPVRRWVLGEDAATEIYGADWADYVIDIPPTMINRYVEGKTVAGTGDITVDLTQMKKRVDLHE